MQTTLSQPSPPSRPLKRVRESLSSPPSLPRAPATVADPSLRVEGVSAVNGPSVFEVLNIFRRQWFLNRDHLISKVTSAQKDACGNVVWVDFDPLFHTSLVRRALTLLPPLCPVAKGKRVMFVFLLEILTGREGAGLSGPGPSFFTPEKSRRVRKRRKAATPSAPRPTPGPPLPGTPAPAAPAPRAPPSLSSSSRARSLSTVPESAIWREGSDNSHLYGSLDRPSPVTLSQVEDLVATSAMIQALHARTPPPALSPTSSDMELDAGPIPTHPPAHPTSSGYVPGPSWIASHPPPLTGDWMNWINAALDNDETPATVAAVIKSQASSPMTKQAKQSKRDRLRMLKCVEHDRGSSFSPSPSPSFSY